MQLIFQNINDL